MPDILQKSIPSHYYVLKKICLRIEEDASNFYLEDCISLNKNEVVLRFRYKEERFLVEAYLGEEESFIFFPERISTPAAPKIVFPELKNKKLISAEAHWQDRSFSLFFEDYSLYFKMYGRNANLLLFKKNKLVSLLKPQFIKDLELTPYLHQNKKRIVADIETFATLKNESGVEKALQKILPSFNQNFYQYLEQENWKNTETQRQWEEITTLLQYLEFPVFYVLKAVNQKEKNNPGIIFSLFHFGEEIFLQTKDIKEALNIYAREYLSARNFLTRKNKMMDALIQKEEKLKHNYYSAQKHLQHLDEDKNYRMQADIIMANLHNIPAAVTEVELFDFFHDRNIIIKIKKEVSPQKWAEKLYQKSKNQEIERDKVLEKILFLEDEREKNKRTLEKIQAVSSNKELRQLNKTELIDSSGNKNKNAVSAFKKFEFENHEIFVGKSAKNNDELTLKFAKKEDIWLHARGVSGSHVIIRKKGNKPVPVSVIRKAAQLAAYYSKGKSASLCPVIYTLKKFVRKPKGAHPGAVVVEREEVIFAEPASFGESESI